MRVIFSAVTPGHSSVPAIMRTILYRKPSAATVIVTNSSSRRTRKRNTRRTVSVIFEPDAMHERKSCRPTKACAASSSAAASSGCGQSSARPFSNGSRRRLLRMR